LPADKPAAHRVPEFFCMRELDRQAADRARGLAKGRVTNATEIQACRLLICGGARRRARSVISCTTCMALALEYGKEPARTERKENMRSRKEGVRPVGRAFAGRRLGVALATAGLLALSLTSVVVASPASAAPSKWNYQNAEHSYCLSSGGIHDTVAKVYGCNGGSNQTWHYGALHGAYAQIINGDGQCLGVQSQSTSAGAYAVVWSCDGHDDQYWLPENNSPGFTVDFLNQHSQMVIQIACDCIREGAFVDQEPYNNSGDPNQLWYPQAAG
jgi:putative hemolysin